MLLIELRGLLLAETVQHHSKVIPTVKEEQLLKMYLFLMERCFFKTKKKFEIKVTKYIRVLKNELGSGNV